MAHPAARMECCIVNGVHDWMALGFHWLFVYSQPGSKISDEGSVP